MRESMVEGCQKSVRRLARWRCSQVGDAADLREPTVRRAVEAAVGGMGSIVKRPVKIMERVPLFALLTFDSVEKALSCFL